MARLKGIRRGIEKESLRALPGGGLALTPHPAALAMTYFKDRLPEVIPGSEARLYFAGALYSIPEAFEAMRQGNLEMTWMQMGKAGSVDPWLMAVVGPGILTTVGAVDNLEKTKTYQMLAERLEKRRGGRVKKSR